jgi:hypothetical protein
LKEIENNNLPESYKRRRMPEEIAKSMDNHLEVKNIRERELIRDNIFLKYKRKKLKPFKKQIDAHNFAYSNLSEGVYSMLISIMNRDINCQIYNARWLIKYREILESSTIACSR